MIVLANIVHANSNNFLLKNNNYLYKSFLILILTYAVRI